MAIFFSVLATAASFLFGSVNFTSGVAAGGTMMSFDVFLLRRVISGLLGEEPKDEKEIKRKRSWLVFQYLLKVIGLLVLLGLIVLKTKISPVGLLIGVTAAIIGPMYVGLRDADDEE